MLRFTFCFFAALCFTPSTARAGTYVAFDITPAYRTGPYNWKGPSGLTVISPTPVDIRASVYGLGLLTHVAVGASFPSRLAIAGELGLGHFSVESTMPYSRPSAISLARLGVRAEKQLTDHAFARAALGYEVMAFSGGGPDLGARENVWRNETTSGPWASLSGGLRGRLIGVVARVDVGRATSYHAVYWPITLSLGLDVAWH